MVDGIELVYWTTDCETYGIGLQEWSVRWWRWLLSIPKEMSPAIDYTGSNATIGQIYPHVFFLCQTIEGVESLPVRKISIPRNQSVFMPLINWISALHVDGETDDDLVRVGKQKMDSAKNLELLLNEQHYLLDFRKLRHSSRNFQANLPENNILDVPPGETRCFSDGYWLFFNTKKTDFKLDTFGTCSSGITKIGVSYDIHII